PADGGGRSMSIVAVAVACGGAVCSSVAVSARPGRSCADEGGLVGVGALVPWRPRRPRRPRGRTKKSQPAPAIARTPSTIPKITYSIARPVSQTARSARRRGGSPARCHRRRRDGRDWCAYCARRDSEHAHPSRQRSLRPATEHPPGNNVRQQRGSPPHRAGLPPASGGRTTTKGETTTLIK